MHFIVMGCGRVGSRLAVELENNGHSVAIIDQDAASFRRLPETFSGRKVVGVGFDRDALVQAGVEEAYALAAVSSGDNSNIIAARVARERFGVGRVVARIYDARRAEVYQRLGITTVATVTWTASQFLRRLLPVGTELEYQDTTGEMALVSLDFHPSWAGVAVREFEQAVQCRAGFLQRAGHAQLVEAGTRLQDGDMLHVFAPAADVAELRRAAARARKEEQ